jgi:thymidylate kinase
VFYLHIDVNTAIKRISSRNTRLSRFDKMDPETRLRELFKYNSYLFELYENSSCKQKHLFSTYRSPEKNAALFVQHLHIPVNYS